jgi:hypothetical protein
LLTGFWDQETTGIGREFVIRGGTLAGQLGMNGDPSFSANRHTIHSQYNASLTERQQSGFIAAVMDGNVTEETNIVQDGTAIHNGAVNVPDFEVGFNSSSPDSQGTISELEILDLDKLTLVPFQTLSGRAGESNGIIGVDPLLAAGDKVSQDKEWD